MADFSDEDSLPHPTPIHLAQRIMENTVTRSISTEPEPMARQCQISVLEAQIKELDEWWGTVLEITAQIEPLELRKKFVGVVMSGRKAKAQVCAFNLDHFIACH
jgi:hypothetical protein